MPEYPSDLATDLLQVLGRKQTLSWSHFKTVFDALCARSNLQNLAQTPSFQTQSPKEWRRQIQVVFQSLGHADFEFGERNRVKVRAATLSRLPLGGFPRAILCGSRGPNTRNEVENACQLHGATLRVQIQTQKDEMALAPDRLEIEARSLQTLQNVAQTLRIDWKPLPLAWESAQLSPTLDEELDAGRRRLGADLPSAEWRKRRFEAKSCTSHSIHQADAVFRRGDFLSYSKLESALVEHFFVDGTLAHGTLAHGTLAHGTLAHGTLAHGTAEELQWVPIDPNWGRYAALRAMKYRVLFYDEKKCLLAVPQGAPLPTPLARAAALCSGYAPLLKELWPREFPLDRPLIQLQSSRPKLKFHLYRDVPIPVAEIIAAKLAQNFVAPDRELSRHLQNLVS